MTDFTMKDITKEITTTENDKRYITGIKLKIPEKLLNKIYDKAVETYEKTGYHPHLLILSQEYARWFRELIQINEYLKLTYNTIVRFNGMEIKITFRDDIIEVY